MRVTEVRIQKAAGGDHQRLLAWVRITLDYCFAVRDIRLVELDNGGILVAMPDKKVNARCQCGWKNILAAKYCNGCGQLLPEDPPLFVDYNGKTRHSMDVAFPITRDFRQELDDAILGAWDRERNFSQAAAGDN